MESVKGTQKKYLIQKKNSLKVGESRFKLINTYLNDHWISYLLKKTAHQSPEFTYIQTEECLKFLYLLGFTNGPIPVSQQVDAIWHLLILETKSYFELCKKLPARVFLHHSSNDFASDTHELETDKTFLSDAFYNAPIRNLEWLVSYVANFGEFTEDAINCWPYAIAIKKQLNIDILSFNKKLVALAIK